MKKIQNKIIRLTRKYQRSKKNNKCKNKMMMMMMMINLMNKRRNNCKNNKQKNQVHKEKKYLGNMMMIMKILKIRVKMKRIIKMDYKKF